MTHMTTPTSYEDAQETFAERLKRLREDRGFTQRQLAELTGGGVSYAYISRLEAAHRQPSVKAIRMLAFPLRVSAAYLELGVEEHDIAGMYQAVNHRYERLIHAVDDAIAMLDELGEEASELAITPAQINEVRTTLTEGRLGRFGQ